MATLALSLAGQVVGGAVGGPIGATIGRALGALAGSAIDSALFGDKPQARPCRAPISACRARARAARCRGFMAGAGSRGNIIWATELEQLPVGETRRQGLWSSSSEDEARSIAANFAVAFCEGEVHRLGRIWADGQLLETDGLTLRFYRGTRDADRRQPDRGQAGRGRAGLSRALLPGVRAAAARAVRQPHPQYLGRALPRGRRARAGDHRDHRDPGRDRFGYDPAPRVRLLGRGVTVRARTRISAANVATGRCRSTS